MSIEEELDFAKFARKALVGRAPREMTWDYAQQIIQENMGAVKPHWRIGLTEALMREWEANGFPAEDLSERVTEQVNHLTEEMIDVTNEIIDHLEVPYVSVYRAMTMGDRIWSHRDKRDRIGLTAALIFQARALGIDSFPPDPEFSPRVNYEGQGDWA